MFFPLVLFGVSLFSFLYFDSPYFGSLYFCSIWTVNILYFLIAKRKAYVFFEPIYLFSAFSLTIPISIFYFVQHDFQNSGLIWSGIFHSPIESVLFSSTVLSFLGYHSFHFGYYFIRRNLRLREIPFSDLLQDHYSPTVLWWVGFFFVLIGVANFAYNVHFVSNDSILAYFQTLGSRKNQFESFGTTIFYQFAYQGAFILFSLFARRKVIHIVPVLLAIILIKISDGRVTGSVLFILSFISIGYFSMGEKNIHKKNFKVFFLFILIMFFAISLYYTRFFFSFLSTNTKWSSISEISIQFFQNQSMIGYVVEKNNLVNIALLMKIIDSWELDSSFLWGQEFLSPFLNFLPFHLRPPGSTYQPSVIVKNLWFSNYDGGALPVTAVGSWFMNFGHVGPIAGLFLMGIFAGYLFFFLVKYRSYWFLMAFSNLTLVFFVYPKGDLEAFDFWQIFPIIVSWMTVSIGNKIYSVFRRRDCFEGLY